MGEFVVHFRPTFGDNNKMSDFFSSHGYSDYLKITFYSMYCFLSFESKSRAESFISHFNGMRHDNYTLNASWGKLSSHERRNSYRDRYDSPDDCYRPRQHDYNTSIRSKTIMVTGYPRHLFTERQLFKDFYKVGFVRQVQIINVAGYIQFDTEEDAIKAIREKERRDRNYSMRIEMVDDIPLNLPKLGIRVIIPERNDTERGFVNRN